VTGAHFRSGYELYAHVIVAEGRGLSDEKLETIVAGQRPSDLTREEGIAYDMAAALVLGRHAPGTHLARRNTDVRRGGRGRTFLSHRALLHGVGDAQHLRRAGSGERRRWVEMKAVQFTRFGPPNVLELIDVPTPKVTNGNAVVQISAAAVNPSDVKNVAGQMEGTVLPRIPGRDFAGVVVDGPDDWVGAEVFGTGGDIGFTRDGSHAEAILLPAQALVRKPTNLSFEQAASIGVNFVIARLGAIEYGGLQSDKTVAIIGAGGGVGGAVAEIAAAQGAILSLASTTGNRRRPHPQPEY
jgi:hypothetical protein